MLPVDTVSKMLTASGFTRISERDDAAWDQLAPNGKYFFTRNQSTVFAVCVGGKYKPGNGRSRCVARVQLFLIQTLCTQVSLSRRRTLTLPSCALNLSPISSLAALFKSVSKRTVAACGTRGLIAICRWQAA